MYVDRFHVLAVLSPAWHVTTLSHSFTRVISGGRGEEEEEEMEEEEEEKEEEEKEEEEEAELHQINQCRSNLQYLNQSRKLVAA